MFGMPFSAAPSTYRRLHLIQPHVNYALSIRIPVSPLHLPVRFEEYIVGILFTLISAFLRRLHLPEHQAGELTSTLQPSIGVPVHGRILFPVYWSTVSLPHSGYRDRDR